MNYTIRQIDEKTIIFDFQPKNVVLSLFLEGDFTTFQDKFLQQIDNVLYGKTSEEEICGNATNVIFKKEETEIEDLYLEGEPTTCTVNTRELRSLMDEWLKKRADFLKRKER